MCQNLVLALHARYHRSPIKRSIGNYYRGK
jgi:hypothetical protein